MVRQYLDSDHFWRTRHFAPISGYRRNTDSRIPTYSMCLTLSYYSDAEWSRKWANIGNTAGGKRLKPVARLPVLGLERHIVEWLNIIGHSRNGVRPSTWFPGANKASLHEPGSLTHPDYRPLSCKALAVASRPILPSNDQLHSAPAAERRQHSRLSMLGRVVRIDALGDIGLCQVQNVSDGGMMIDTSIEPFSGRSSASCL